jgi:hypothetical protein
LKERLITLALAIAAFAAFYALMGPKPGAPQEKATRPTSIESGPNGYLGLMRWLTAERVPVISLRDRYGKLQQLPGLDAESGNLMLTTAPQLYPLRHMEVGPLRSWVSQGNTLLIVAGLSDTPDWSMDEGIDPDFMENMEAMTDLRFQQVPATPVQPEANAQNAAPEPPVAPAPKAPESPTSPEQSTSMRDAMAAATKYDEPARFEMKPAGPHPLLEGVATVGALSEYPSAKWRAWLQGQGEAVVELAHDPVSGAPVLWVLPSGKGQIILSAYGSIFTNKALGHDDNARLLANVVRWSVLDGGKFIIDDAHQGLVAFYDPAAFFGDSRLHLTLWWLIGLWLVFVVSSQRLRPAVSKWNPVDITGFVRATGGFMARVLRPAVVGQQLFANFFNDTRLRMGLPPNGEPVWDWLSVQAAVPSQDIQRLQELHAKVQHGRRVDLLRLHNLLVRVRTALQ